MNESFPVNPEIENLLLLLAEHPAEKDKLLPVILRGLPWGYHPSLIVENIENPEHRLMIRDNLSRLLILEKQKEDLNFLLRHPESDHFTEKGAFLFTYFTEDINYSFQTFSSTLDELARPLQKHILSLENPPEIMKVKMFLHYFFHDLEFKGNVEDPLHIDNYMIHRVLDSRKGGAILLCILANGIAERAGIQLPIVITAGHFLLRTLVEKEIPFIDPYQNGRIVTEYEHMNNVASKGYDPSIALLHIKSPITLFQNLARNMVQAVQATGDKNLLESARTIREILKEWVKNH